MADNMQVAWNATTRVATVQAKGDGLPVGSVRLGYFGHDVSTDDLGDNPANGAPLGENHVFYHHVRDFLYHAGEQNMQTVRINNDVDYVALTAYTIVQTGAIALAIGANVQLTHVLTPANASNTKMSYVSSVPAKATVSATGLVHGVAAGATVITVTSDDGAIVRTTTVTVS